MRFDKLYWATNIQKPQLLIKRVLFLILDVIIFIQGVMIQLDNPRPTKAP